MHLLDYIMQHAKNNEDCTAFKVEEKEITYGDLQYYINLNRNKLCELGFTENDEVMLLYENPLDWIIGLLSLLSLNSIVLPLDSHIESKKLENLKETLNNPKVLNNEVYKIHYEKTFLVDRCRILVDEKKAGILHCTSGSTSRPKLCYRTLAALTAEGRSFKELLYITEKDKILGLPPLYHSFALGAALMSSIVSGASLILIPQFKPRQALEVIIDEKVSIVVLVPIMAKVISNLADKKNEKYDSLRVALCGAGAVNQELYDTFKSAFGVNLMCNYGSTETGGIISRVSNEYIGAIGKPMPGVSIKIKDEFGDFVKAGNQGELWVKSDEIMETYYHQDTIFDDEGYFPTGDIVYQNNKGYIFIVGRKKSIIKIGGKTVDLNLIRDVISELPGVVECAVIAKEELESPKIKLIINTNEQYSKKEIIIHCKTKLDQYHVPHEIIFTTELKRNSLNKLDLSKYV